ATAISIAPTVTSTTLAKIVCHNHSGSYPPGSGNLATTAVVAATGAVNVQIAAANGPIYIYGVTFQAGSGASVGAVVIGLSNHGMFFDTCSLQSPSTGSGATIQWGGGGGFTNAYFNNTTLKFGGTGQSINLASGGYVWQNSSGLAAGS